MRTVPCIVICQPWAWAIFHAPNRKRLENRTWRTSYTGPLLILAGSRRRQTYQQEIEWLISKFQPCPPPELLPFGAIVGIVEQVACQRPDVVLQQSDMVGQQMYADGPWCHVYKDAWPFREPVPYRGQQRLFRVEASVVAAQLLRCPTPAGRRLKEVCA